MTRIHWFGFKALLMLCVILVRSASPHAQDREPPGRSIGKVSVVGNLIFMELDEGALGRQNLFDLGQRTLRFTPASGGYRVESLPLRWDGDFGEQLTDHQVGLHNFSFPFSGKPWNSFSVGVTGSIRFTPENSTPADATPGLGTRGNEGGVSIGRFDPLTEGAAMLVNTDPAICVFFKPRMSGNRYVKELQDRVVVTWDVTEPWGNIQDFTWTKTVNRFQAVLYKDGAIEMSYEQLAAKDAIVGIYPLISGGAERLLATLAGNKNSSIAAHLDIQNLKLSVVDGLFLKATFQTAGPVLPEGDSGLSGIAYRVHFYAHKPFALPDDAASADLLWTIRGFRPRNRAGASRSRYVAFGPGVSRRVKTNGNTISIQGIMPLALRGAKQIAVSADASASGSDEPVARISAGSLTLSGIRDPKCTYLRSNRKMVPSLSSTKLSTITVCRIPVT